MDYYFKTLLLGCIFLSLYKNESFAQSILTLRPQLGLEMPTCFIQEKSLGYSGFGVNRLPVGLNGGLVAQFNFKDRYFIAAGVSYGVMGYDFTVNIDKARLQSYRGSIIRVGYASELTYLGFPIEFGIKLKEARWLPLHDSRFLSAWGIRPSKPTYLFLCKLNLKLGFNINHIQRLASEGVPFNFYIEGFAGDYVEYTTTYSIQRRWGVAIYGGLNLQFHHRGKDRLAVNILYQQGLQKRVDVMVDYDLNGDKFFNRLGSRGSGVILQLSYPIRLAKFKQRGYEVDD
ncbi:MAG: hypothetical protein MUE85_15580 [Microscillaceae bacterium]|jgi:hypothetical protein|nr:hypothetical protein [Microscillaceae bacterium]